MPALHRDIAQVVVELFQALGAPGAAALRAGVQILGGAYDVYEGDGVCALGEQVVPARAVRVLDVVVRDPAEADAAWATPPGDEEAAARSFPDERFGFQPLVARRQDGVLVETHLVQGAWYALARMPVGPGGVMADWLLRLHRTPGEPLRWARVSEVTLPVQTAFQQVCVFFCDSGVQGQELVSPVGQAVGRAEDAAEAGPITADGALHWMVPCRRAVVRTELDYAALLGAWRASLALPAHRERLRAWYALSEAQVESALGWLERYRLAWSDGGTFEGGDGAPWARLWLGPLRVLHQADEARTWWSARREVAPADSEGVRAFRFQVGDVVELPLFKWLAAALGADSGWASQRFAEAGSFFLGDSVVGADGRVVSEPALRLHDDLLAMRFQALSGLARAAFYDLSPTFTGGYATRALHHAVGRRRVYGRGFMYSGTMASPHHNRVDEAWKLHCYNWMSLNDGVCSSLPQRGGFDQLPANTALTPGWACTPCVLFLAAFLLDVPYVSRGGSAAATFRDATTELAARGTVVRDERGEGQAAALVEALNHGLTDLNVIALSSHEFAVVRLGRAADLMSCVHKPFAHQLAAYDPLSGAPQAAGLTYFEAAGLLSRLSFVLAEGEEPKLMSSLSLLPFKFSSVRPEGLQASLRPDGRVDGDRRDSRMSQVYRVTGDTLRAAWERPGPHGPVVLGDRRSRMIGSVAAHPEGLRWRNLYGTRALPSPTMGEVRDAGLYTTRDEALEMCRTTAVTVRAAVGLNAGSPEGFLGTVAG
jgi:hypothetical protein